MSAFRKLAAAALLSVILPSAAPVFAQDAGDPPDSVARIAEISGTVSFHAAGSQEWQAASPNYPVTAGSGVWAEPRSHAAVDINGARIHLDGASDLEIAAIDPQAVQLSVSQGAVFVHVYPGATGQTYTVDTPRGEARIAQPGQYEIEAGDDQHPMTLSVYEGAAQLVGQSANLVLQPGQRGLINPDNSSGTAAAQPDDFVRMVQAAEQPYANAAQTAQYVSPAETGYQDLARYGTWQSAPQYGAVWYPQQVAAGWAPYRYGHWAYVAPWGWTWVDDAAWGFTPFHYGRWVQIGGRWGWVPGERVVRPVYAPALVTFFGNIGGISIDLSVGWVPLAPEEVYVPPYRHTPRYVRDINIVNVHNETKIVNVVNNVTVVNYNSYANRRAATVVDRQTMAGSRPVAAAFRSQPQGNDPRWNNARPVAQVAVQPQVQSRPGNAPKFNQHQTSNAQFAAQAGQGRPKSWNGNGQFTSQPQQSQPKPSGQRPKNAAPGPVIVPQVNASAGANAPAKQQQAKPQWQGQQQQQGQTAKKSKNAAPGPVILPQNANGQPNGQAASQSQWKQKPWQNGQAPGSTAASGSAAPSWKQSQQAKPSTSPAVVPNQLPASIQSNAAPSQQGSQKHKQKDTSRNTQQPQAAQPLPQFTQPVTQPGQKPSGKPWQPPSGGSQNGGWQNQSKQSQAHGQQQPQGQPQWQGKQQNREQGKALNKPQNPACNAQTGACTQ